jgi:transcriptional regulator with XRE-family HTH domain
MTGTIEAALAALAIRHRLPPPALRREIRQLAGLTQEDIANALRIDRASVARWEAGTREPRHDLLRPYLELLDRLLEELDSRAGGDQ